MKLDMLGARAAEVAAEMLNATAGVDEEQEPLSEDNSRQRSLDPELRTRFLEVRTTMQRLGLIDPVLNRFDGYTVPQATTREVAERLKEIADSLSAGSDTSSVVSDSPE